MKNQINYDDEHNPIIEVYIDGHRYTHSVRGFDKSIHSWYLGVFAIQMQEVNDRAYKKGKAEVSQGIKYLLGIK